MKVFSLLLLAAAILPALTTAADDLADMMETSIPGIYVSSLVHDFNEVYWWCQVSTQFNVYNHTDRPLMITKIHPDCGCRVMYSDGMAVAPGDHTTLSVIYDPEFHTGEFSKIITVYTDILGEMNHFRWFAFHLKGRIVSVLSFDPWHVYFRRTVRGEAAETTVAIRSSGSESVSISGVESNSEHLNVSLDPSPELNSDAWTMTLRLLETASAGAFYGSVTVKTDHAVQKSIHLPVYAWIRGPVSVMPTQCYLGTLAPGQTISRTFTVDTAAADLDPPTITSLPEWMTYSVDTVRENRRYSIKITVTVPENLTGRLTGSFTIETNDASSPAFEIPVFGYVLSEDVASG